MEMSELCVSPGMMCASRAASGSCGRARVQLLLEDLNEAPLGSPTVMIGRWLPFVSCGSWGRM
jgi:hypothetical protein